MSSFYGANLGVSQLLPAIRAMKNLSGTNFQARTVGERRMDVSNSLQILNYNLFCPE
ncbi:MAG: hypothetical protein ACI9CB_000381 [Rhodothermales bacterium]|jgi:hypothetical protein